MTLFTSIKPEILRRAIMRGSFLGGLGILLFLFAGIFLPFSVMKAYGWAVFCLGLFLILWGFYPYRRLKWLEVHPNKISINEEALEYYENQTLKIRVPLANIQGVQYRDENNYGLTLLLKDSSTLFFPYFRESACKKIADLLRE